MKEVKKIVIVLNVLAINIEIKIICFDCCWNSVFTLEATNLFTSLIHEIINICFQGCKSDLEEQIAKLRAELEVRLTL